MRSFIFLASMLSLWQSPTLSLCIVWNVPFFSASADLKLLLHPREVSTLCSHHHQTKELCKSKSETPAAPGYEWDAHLQHNWYFYLAAFWDSAQVFFVQHRCGHIHMEQSPWIQFTLCDLFKGDRTNLPSSALPQVPEQPLWGVSCWETQWEAIPMGTHPKEDATTFQ